MSAQGQWDVTMDTPIGTLRFAWDLAEENGAWRGKMIGQPPVGNSDLAAIQVAGNAVAFETTAKSPMGALQLKFEGTVAERAMQGVCKTKFGDNRFSAVRRG